MLLNVILYHCFYVAGSKLPLRPPSLFRTLLDFFCKFIEEVKFMHVGQFPKQINIKKKTNSKQNKKEQKEITCSKTKINIQPTITRDSLFPKKKGSK